MGHVGANHEQLCIIKITYVQAHVLHCLLGKEKFGHLETLNVIHRVNAPAYSEQQFGG